MELVKFKVVNSGNSCNIITNEDSYYAKGINGRTLVGEDITIMYLTKKESRKCARKIGKIYKKC